MAGASLAEASAGQVPGTKLVVMWGGPPEWDGRMAGVLRACKRLERWDHTADAPLVYEATGQLANVEVVKIRRRGRIAEKKVAEVFTCRGYREETDG